MRLVAIEVTVVVEERNIVLNAPSGNQTVYCFAHRHAFATQQATVLRTFHRQGGVNHLHLMQFHQSMTLVNDTLDYTENNVQYVQYGRLAWLDM